MTRQGVRAQEPRDTPVSEDAQAEQSHGDVIDHDCVCDCGVTNRVIEGRLGLSAGHHRLYLPAVNITQMISDPGDVPQANVSVPNHR